MRSLEILCLASRRKAAIGATFRWSEIAIDRHFCTAQCLGGVYGYSGVLRGIQTTGERLLSLVRELGVARLRDFEKAGFHHRYRLATH